WTQPEASEVVGVVHGVAYLSPSLKNHISPHQVHWRRNNNMKLASRDSDGRVQYPNSSYKGRLELFPNNTLKITHLQKNDSSTYQVYLEDNVGKEHIENILLVVYDLVPKPVVSARVFKSDLELCNATLECWVGVDGVIYEWIPPQRIQVKDGGAAEQPVSFNPLVETYTCRVRNPVSSNSSLLIYKHPCSWTAESSAAASCTVTSVLVALGHLLLLLLLLALI
ncbi:PREDICTED: CD48 antigen-like, partial [Merops nubicus]|uniref:CD48 antigen-like n=1 Tax=Merops nubicus TaxID=57421 RepID=UPI0004F04B05